MSFQII